MMLHHNLPENMNKHILVFFYSCVSEKILDMRMPVELLIEVLHLPANISKVKWCDKRIFADLIWLVDLFFLAVPCVLCPTFLRNEQQQHEPEKSLENSKTINQSKQ